MEEKIIYQFTDFVFPFRYQIGSDPGDAAFTSAKGASVKLFERFSQESRELRQGISDLLSEDGGSAKIADCFRLSNNARAHFGLPRRLSDPLVFLSREGKEYGVAIEGIKLYLFESGVGFVDVECRYKSDSAEDYINCNYFLCEMKSEANRFEGKRQIWNDTIKQKQDEPYRFSMLELIHAVLGYVEGVRDMKHDGPPAYKEEKGIIYSYLLLDRKPQDFEDFLFHARKNYKESYRFPRPAEGKPDPYVRQQFENSYWAASFNGAVNVSWLTGEETTDSFFRDSFPPKLHATYFSLFLHILHQRHALLKFIGEMGTLDKLALDYGVMKQQLKKANAYRAAAANLKFRAFFLMPSGIEHVNDYFNLLYRTFQIKAIYDSFSNDLQAVREICDSYVVRIKAREEKLRARRKARIGVFVSVFGTVVSVAALLNSYWGIIEKISGHAVSFFSVEVLAAVVAILLPVITVAVDVFIQAREIHLMSLDLKDEVKDELVETDRLRRKRKRMRRKASK